MNVLRLAPALAILCAACSRDPLPPGEPSPRAAAGEPSLVLITLDTFRRDAAGCGGEPRARTPWLDRLARTGLQFDAGVAPAPLTSPSHTTVLTGLDPPAHGVRNNASFRLPEGVPTVTEALAAAGFATDAVVAAHPLLAKFGLARGFDTYDDALDAPAHPASFLMTQRSGDDVANRAIERLGRVDPERRFFLWAHFFDAHAPYTAPPLEVRSTGGVPYLAEAARVDRHVGRIARALVLSGRSAWIVILADHGESLGAHGEGTHGTFVYEETVRVPAIVWPAPAGERAGVRRGLFRLRDFPATAFELLGLDPASAPGHGSSVLSTRPRHAYFECLQPYYGYGWAKLRGVVEGRWKYIDAPAPELYDLHADPGETTNLAGEHPEVTARLAALLADESSDAEGEELPMDEETRAKLESLGYVAASPGDTREDLPDPKDMVRVSQRIALAQRAMSAGDYATATHSLQLALSWDPRNKEVYSVLGTLYATTGRDRQAVEAYLRCIELPPQRENRWPRFELASAYLRLGEPAAAEAQLEEVVRLDPDDSATWNNLGVARIQQGKRDGARAAWSRALELDPGNEAALDAMRRTE